ncbi:MAG: ribosome biogenesis GTPase Der [Armatimonadota bacterium]|nr:ribosome biogenesis GTPase Der [Armatimonadota bacterium]MDR5697209.1 ribosome biogenesis GTPase Der [Armatimonadota bacterium]
MRPLPVVAIVGRPNVGKSALFNRIVGRRLAIVEDTPGITRDRLYAEADWDGRRFVVTDTGGIVVDAQDPIVEQVRRQAEIAVREADVVLLVTDVQTGMVPDDAEVAQVLRRARVPVLLVANKADNPRLAEAAAEFHRLGLGEPIAVSAHHGIGVAELLDEVVRRLPDGQAAPGEAADTEEAVRVAFVGRPNVGKSSLVNALVGTERVIVDDRPGTTRDAVDTVLRRGGRTFVLVDTAGMRRRSRVHERVEVYGVSRARRAIAGANVVVLVVDASQRVTDQDQQIARYAAEAGRAMVIAANKWDLMRGADAAEHARRLHHELRHVRFAPVVFVSAKTGRNVARILDAVERADAAHARRIATGPLNRAIEEAEAAVAPPADRRGRRLKIYYATQVAPRPPTMVLFVNHPEIADPAYVRYLEGRLRQAFDFEGTPLRLFVRARRAGSRA